MKMTIPSMTTEEQLALVRIQLQRQTAVARKYYIVKMQFGLVVLGCGALFCLLKIADIIMSIM